MNPLLQLGRRSLPLVALLVVGVIALGLPVLQATRASAATVEWVDGGDDQHCLQDDKGAALVNLAEDKWCQPIPTCHEYDGNNPKYKGRIVQSSASTGIWQGAADEVLYADNLPSDYNLTPTPTKSPTPKPSASPAPTKAPTPGTTPTPRATPAPGRTPAPGTTPSPGASRPPTSAPAPGATSAPGVPAPAAPVADDLGIDPDEAVVPGAPSAPGTPTLTVDGTTIVVTWEPSVDVDLDSVTGYVVLLSGGNRAEVDAATTTYAFPDLPDGSYRAAVRAVNDVGESAASTPSEPVTIGTPPASVVGTLTWTGEVVPGATVTLTGAGYAAGVDLDVELHSDPVRLTTVTTDEQGSFATDVVVPDDAPEGAHHFVVAYQGTVVSESPVTVAAASPVAAGDEATTSTETVPPLTGLVILGALAVAGVLLLASHYARGGARRAARSPSAAPADTAVADTVVAGAAVADGPTDPAPTRTALPPLQLGNPLLTAFAPAPVAAPAAALATAPAAAPTGVAPTSSPAPAYPGVHVAPEAGQLSVTWQFAPPARVDGPSTPAAQPVR